MKTKYRNIIFAIAGLVLISSCSKNLNQINPNAQTSASFWKTSTDALQGINAAYAPLLLDGLFMRFTPVLTDVRGDDVRSNSPWTAIRNAAIFSLNTSDPSGYGWTFDELYEGVYRCNQVLDFVPGIQMDQNLKNRILGQAYFLRGLYFFYLADLFGNVAIPLHAPQSPKDFFSPQMPADSVWAQAIADFKAAIPLLPVSYANINGPDNQVGRATKGAAMAFLGKTYLFNHMYQQAAEQFKNVIDLGVYDLMPNYADNFDGRHKNNQESIFEVQFSLTAGGQDLGWQGIPSSTWAKTNAIAITYGPPNFGWTDVQPSFYLFNEFQKEKTIDSSLDPRLDVTILYNKPGEMLYGQYFSVVYAGTPYLNDIFCKKYENWDTKPNEFDWKSGKDYIIMRYADVLLMYAECENELGNVAECAHYIQMVRNRVNLPDREAEFATYSQDQMRAQISHERLLEFALEGHRFDDIRRWGWLNDSTKLNELKQHDPEFNYYKPGRDLLPIPQGEIDNNPGFKQNPSY
ncbi:putative outer membrane starch-binding protein [Thermoflavifilum aggregans]|uniref:Putative outer membrane starch-binding protein n=1 Tax=Thermoflavifilum aggregans TaxID=454188 RepID=A0A2M9CTJ7_9BACT|nr:RagB/SusD family nutrient uptake outer membrane protein [Thermoflavifilum aggregans]PJJ75223.1 putative outer membrane starch-binding protein [Thermoflavifilum aggregans]